MNAPLGDAAKHPQFKAAKSGDLVAASILVSDLITDDAVNQLEQVIGDKKTLLVPVHAEEAVSINRIPLAYAVAIARKFDLDVELNVVQAARVNRTGSNGFARLAFPPPFDGEPSIRHRHAIIFDDTLTQGGTLANLTGYIAGFNIQTIAATTLTGKNYSSTLALTAVTLNSLRKQYDELEKWWREYFGYGFEALTESEARYILKSKKTANEIRDKIVAERQAGLF